jgi:hypothetical protein
MMLNSALMLLIKSFGAALLMAVDKRYFVSYLICDMGFYLLQKLARGDFWYWIPVHGGFGVFLSVLLRIVIKTIADFTGIVQFRGAAEMGGIYWSANMLMAIPASYTGMVIYYHATDSTELAMEERSAKTFFFLLSGAYVCSFAVFFWCIKKKFRKTFYSLETGCEWAMSFFLKGDTDVKRVKPLRLNKNKWKRIRPEMKEYVLENWLKWEDEKPEFFTDAFKKRVDDDMIPTFELKKEIVAGGGKRRRSSLGEMMGGGASSRRGGASSRRVGASSRRVGASSRRGSATVVPAGNARRGGASSRRGGATVVPTGNASGVGLAKASGDANGKLEDVDEFTRAARFSDESTYQLGESTSRSSDSLYMAINHCRE